MENDKNMQVSDEDIQNQDPVGLHGDTLRHQQLSVTGKQFRLFKGKLFILLSLTEPRINARGTLLKPKTDSFGTLTHLKIYVLGFELIDEDHDAAMGAVKPSIIEPSHTLSVNLRSCKKPGSQD